MARQWKMGGHVQERPVKKTILLSWCIITAATCGVARADHPGVGFATGIAGPAITIPATTLPKGTGAVAVRLEYLKFSTFSDGELAAFAREDVDTHSVAYLVSPSLAAAYGFTDDLTAGVRLPYLIRSDIRAGHRHEGDEEGEVAVHRHGDADGVGDLVALGQYRFFKGNSTRFETALLFGLKMPTGSTGVRDRDGERFEVEHQPGSGSWDPLLGLAASKRVGAASLDANVLYTFVTSGARQTNLGDRLHYNLAVSYRLGTHEEHHHEHEHHEHEHHEHEHQGDVHEGDVHEAIEHEGGEHRHPAWDLILELNGEWQQKQKVAGQVDPNSGGSLLFVSPGARFCGPGGWSATISVGIPVMERQNGIQHGTDLRTVFVLAKGF